jgi:hypothetical protein
MDDTSAPRSAHAAHDDLRYIRQTLAAAGHISTVPGKGLVLIGVLTLVAVGVNFTLTGAPWNPPQSGDATTVTNGLLVWLALLAASLLAGGISMRGKARRTQQVFWSPVLRKACWGYGAAMSLGAILTGSLLAAGLLELLPEIWLGCYGVALVAAGGYSVSPVRWMGMCFLLTAAGAAVTPANFGLAWLALGFGWVHIAFGAYIAWRHDG